MRLSPVGTQWGCTGQAEPGAFAGGLGRDKGLEQFVPDLRRDAGPDQGGWNLFHTSANGAQLEPGHSVVTCVEERLGWVVTEEIHRQRSLRNSEPGATPVTNKRSRARVQETYSSCRSVS
jgi:hypothetical protein